MATYSFFQGSVSPGEDGADIDVETMSQAFCNIVAGACMAIGLKFAGSSNQDAFECLVITNMLIAILFQTFECL